MMNMMAADFRRVSRRIAHHIVTYGMLLVMALLVCVWMKIGLMGRPGAEFYIRCCRQTIKPLSLMVGVLEFIFLFGADMEANTVRVVIGLGIPRRSLILGKYMEYFLFTLADVVCYFILMVCLGNLFLIGIQPLGADYVGKLFAVALTGWVRAAALGALGMIFLFFFQGMAAALLAYIALVFKIPYYFVSFIDMIANRSLKNYTLSYALDLLNTGLNGGWMPKRALIIIMIYIILSFVTAVMLFHKKELEF